MAGSGGHQWPSCVGTIKPPHRQEVLEAAPPVPPPTSWPVHSSMPKPGARRRAVARSCRCRRYSGLSVRSTPHQARR